MALKKRFRKFLTLSAFVAVFLILMFSMAMFSGNYIRERTGQLAIDNFQNIMTFEAESFKLKFETDQNVLLAAASLIEMPDSLVEVQGQFNNFEYLSTRFEYIALANTKGEAIDNSGIEIDISDRDYYQKSLKGETVIADLIQSRFTDEYSIAISTPVFDDGEIVGVLLGLNSVEFLGGTFGDVEQEGVMFNSVINSDNTVVINGISAASENIINQNLFDLIAGVATSFDPLNTLSDKLAEGVSGYTYHTFDNEVFYITYTPLDINDWMMISITPQTNVTSVTDDITMVTNAVSMIGLFLLILLTMIVYLNNRKNIEAVSEVAFVSELTRINTAQKFKLDAPGFIRKHRKQRLLIIKFDVENFKLVNESLGTKKGDHVLICMAKAMGSDEPDRLCAHLHDDEFVALISECDPDYGPDSYNKYLKRFHKLLGPDFNYRIRIVAGFYYYNAADNVNIEDAIERANVAHRHAKNSHENISIYSEEYIADAIKRKNIENRMEFALQNREFTMVLQPELSLETGQMIAAEALVRWQSPDGPMRPDEFVPVFEKSGFIVKLDMYVFEMACAYLKKWISEGRTPITISVNFSRIHLMTENFVDELNRISDQYNISPKHLGIEITETSMLDNEEIFLSVMKVLQRNGYKVLMDDFGSGYSSLGLLKSASVDVLKLDRSFLVGADNRTRSTAVVRSIISLSKDLKISTIAEGVETLEDAIILKEMGCNIIQGYYYGKPMSQEALKQFYDSEESIMML